MSSIDDRALVASEAAWLVHVNDDRVRDWFKDATYPATEDGSPRKSTTWRELSEYCHAKRKRLPLPLDMLDLDANEARDLLALMKPSTEGPKSEDGLGEPGEPQGDIQTDPQESLDPEIASLRRQLREARLREEGLRRSLREQVLATAHGDDKAAAERRALIAMIDTAEDLAREDGHP